MSTSATGYLCEVVPRGERLDEILGLVRIGQLFKKSQCGRRPDAITKYITGLVKQLPQATFASLLEKLEAESARHDYGAGECACTRVNRIFQAASFWHPKRGEEVEISFPSLIVKLSRLKKSLINSGRK